MKVIGVTGTNGKTTTSCLIAGVLASRATGPGLLGTLGYFDGDDVEAATHTTPPPESWPRCLARMVDNGCTHAVMEVSSHALDQSRVAGVCFDAACVTNVTPRSSRLPRTPRLPPGKGEALRPSAAPRASR